MLIILILNYININIVYVIRRYLEVYYESMTCMCVKYLKTNYIYEKIFTQN